MYIEKTDGGGYTFLDGLTCNEHGSKAVFLLMAYYGGVIVPLCQECVDELYNGLAEYVSPEVRDANKKG